MKYEFKYIVPVSLMDELRDSFKPYMESDPYAAMMTNKEYTVRSIYFDTPHFDYYFEKLDGYKIRKKIRIRGYNEQVGDDIVFLEIKRKLKEPIEKSREKMTFELVRKLLGGNRLFEEAGANTEISDRINGAGQFFYHVYSQSLRPVVLVIYEREAYNDRFRPNIRLTIDKNLRSIAYPGIDDLFSENKVKPALKDHFIFEIKFKEDFPFWLRPVIGKLGLIKRSASKYVITINSHHLTEGASKSVFYRKTSWNGIH